MIELNEKFKENMKNILKDEFAAFEKALNEPPVKALRINTLKTDIETALKEIDFLGLKVPWTNTGFYHNLDRIGNNEFYIAGAVYPQDASAMAPAEILSPCPGDRVLDLCAAPGGKTTQMAAMMKGRGILIANEIISSRAKILYENVERMGIKNCVITNESPQKLENHFEGYFDKILVDAPCSGEGMFRKDPAALREWNENINSACAIRQLQILSSAAKMLKTGGTLVYSTCTFSPVENEQVMESFIKKYPEFEVDKIDNPKLSDGFSPMENTKRIWPHIQKGEGHFIAKLKKNNGEINELPLKQTAIEKDIKIYRDFEKQYLKDIKGYLYLNGSRINIFPMQLPEIKGLKLICEGICAGEIIKGRFEPHHQLSRGMDKSNFNNIFELDENTLYKYIKGETFETDIKGWCGVFYKNWGIGIGKGAGGVLKNHYPKGLRK